MKQIFKNSKPTGIYLDESTSLTSFLKWIKNQRFIGNNLLGINKVNSLKSAYIESYSVGKFNNSKIVIPEEEITLTAGVIPEQLQPEEINRFNIDSDSIFFPEYYSKVLLVR